MQVDDSILAVLSAAEINGRSLVLTGQLDRKLYVKTNDVLVAAGGKWNRKERAHLFDGDAAEAIEPILLTGTVTNAKQEFGAFYTPPEIAADVIAMAAILHGMSLLEPSAGRGALAAPALAAGALVDCVEIDTKSVDVLQSGGYRGVCQADFLTLQPAPLYDRVVMNPPFARQDDIRHVMHAWQFLKPEGRMVAIMSAGIKFRDNKLTTQLRAILNGCGGTITDIPEGAFKVSGTMVKTVVIEMRCPA
jgi:predicted RNA methylase